MAQILGPISIICYVLLLVSLKQNSIPAIYRIVAVSIGSFFVLITNVSEREKVENIYSQTSIDTSKSNLILFGLLMVITLSFIFIKRSNYMVFALTFFTAYLTFSVNPIQQNLGSVVESDLSKTVKELNFNDAGSWASDSRSLDAVLLANVHTTLSGQQLVGPNLDNWLIIDPTSGFSPIWNRGASFVSFNWKAGEELTIENPANDVILISASPCNKVLSDLKLKWLLSTKPLTDSCLTEKKEIIQSSGTIIYLYRTKVE
jgi:hypothetical protein